MRSVIALAMLALFIASPAYGQPESKKELAKRHELQEDKDGVLKPNEYFKISPNGSITRSWCPYTCSMRNLSHKNCRTWQSKIDPTQCYVQDTRIPSDAVPVAGTPKGHARGKMK